VRSVRERDIAPSDESSPRYLADDAWGIADGGEFG
jgi:hypothetical protein